MIRIVIAAVISFLSFQAYADAIFIKPGQSIQIMPSTLTTVTCSGSRDDQRKVVSRYCSCSYGTLEVAPAQKGYRLKQIIAWDDGNRQESLIEEYEIDSKQCETAKSSHPACR